MELFDVGPAVAFAAIAATVIVILGTILYFIHSAPPTTLTITTGPEGSVYYKYAQKYAEILQKDGIKLKILTSHGSLENLARLADPKSHVDIGIAQGGIEAPATRDLYALASISYQPLLVFYRGAPIELLSQLSGKRVAIGPDGSGARKFALELLNANGIQEKDSSTTLVDWEGEQAYKGLLEGKLDAAFMMSEDAAGEVLKKLLRSSEIRLLNFKQATAYSRKIDYLNVMDLPEGAIDFGKNIPEHDMTLLGPMVELVATKNLHPALSDLVLEAAKEVHNKNGIFSRRGDFPAPIRHAIHVSPDAKRFFTSGKGFMYRYFPFWLASLANRIVVAFLPMLVILLPALKSIPAFFRWKTQKTIHRRYRELLALEKELQIRGADKETLRARFDQVEDKVNRMKIPPRYADQFYGLRGHIDFVRQLVARRA